MSRFDDMMNYGENRERFYALKEKLDVIVPFGFPQWKVFYTYTRI